VGSRLSGIDESDIEHYHRIRNTLYHNGSGLSVDVEYLLAYRQIGVLILRGLFGVNPLPPKPAPTLEHLIVLWNRLEEQVKAKLEKSGIDRGYTYYCEAKRGQSTILDSKRYAWLGKNGQAEDPVRVEAIRFRGSVPIQLEAPA
jgi:hypothetical protein